MGADDHPDTERPQRYLSHQHLSLQRSSTRNEGEVNVCVCVRVCVCDSVCTCKDAFINTEFNVLIYKGRMLYK